MGESDVKVDLGLTDLNARSVVISTLLGSQYEELPASAIVRTAELFGIAPGTTRVALTRLLAAGDVHSLEGVYTLADHHQARRARQLRSVSPQVKEWTGSWLTAVVMIEGREPHHRLLLREAFRRERFVELRESIWMRPDNIDHGATTPAMHTIEEQCQWMFSEVGPDLETTLLERFAPATWAETADALEQEMLRLMPRLKQHDPQVFRRAFIVEGGVLRHLMSDPLLPEELLDAGWPGQRVRDTYKLYDEHFLDTLTLWNGQQD